MAERAALAEKAKARSAFTPLRAGLIAFAVIGVAAVAWSMRPHADPAPHAKKKRAPAPIAAADAASPNDAAQAPQPAQAPEPAPAQPVAVAAFTPPPPPEPSNSPPTPEAFHAPAPAPVAKSPARHVAVVSSSNANRAMFSDAEKLLAKKQSKPAMRTLFFLLDRPDLTGSERAKATRMMAEAETIAGNKDAAIDWYKKYLQVTDNATERARVVQQIRKLNQ